MRKYGPNDSLPGYGDEATWPPCANHPNDPRSPEPDEDDLDPDVERDPWIERQYLDKQDADYRRSVAREDDGL